MSSGKLLVECGVDGFAKRRRAALEDLREPLYYYDFPKRRQSAYSRSLLYDTSCQVSLQNASVLYHGSAS